jgi:hypothetical protein
MTTKKKECFILRYFCPIYKAETARNTHISLCKINILMCVICILSLLGVIMMFFAPARRSFQFLHNISGSSFSPSSTYSTWFYFFFLCALVIIIYWHHICSQFYGHDLNDFIFFFKWICALVIVIYLEKIKWKRACDCDFHWGIVFYWCSLMGSINRKLMMYDKLYIQ